MNPRAIDLYVRSFTTAALAIVVVLIAGYQIIHQGAVDTSVGSFVGLVLGFYFGAHTAQNAAGQRSRAEALAVETATGEKAPPDPYGSLKLQPDGENDG